MRPPPAVDATPCCHGVDPTEVDTAAGVGCVVSTGLDAHLCTPQGSMLTSPRARAEARAKKRAEASQMGKSTPAAKKVPWCVPFRSPSHPIASQVVLLTARVHPGETGSSYVMEGIIDFLVGDSEEALLSHHHRLRRAPV